MKNSKYWEKRQLLHEAERQKKSDDFVKSANAAYEEAISKLEEDIAARLIRIADDNGISVTEAMRRLSKGELKGWKMKIEEFIELSKKSDIPPELEIAIKNASHRVHLSHLEEMKMLIDFRMRLQFSDLDNKLGTFLGDIWDDVIKHNTDSGIDNLSTGYSEDALKTALSKPWASDGKTFSTRIWEDGQKVSKKLQVNLEQNILLGKNPKDIVKDLKGHFPKNRKSDIERLVKTEQAYVASAADHAIWKELGVDRYEICAILDSRTSEICREMDGKVFNLEDRKVGINAPPFHPRCRTVTVPYFEDDETEKFKNVNYDYKDATDEWKEVKPQKAEIVNDLSEWTHNENKYVVDGKHVVLDYDKHEKEIADLLAEKYGKRVQMVPRVLYPEGIKTPDYLIDGEKWDLKTLTKDATQNTLYNRIYKAKKQASNFIVDLTNSKLTDDIIENQIEYIFNSKSTRHVKNIIIIKNRKITKAIKRK